MECFIYKSLRKPDAYLYLIDKDNFLCLPDELQKALGRLEWVMNLELYPEKKLALADSKIVINTLTEQGYYLQLPPQNFNNPQ